MKFRKTQFLILTNRGYQSWDKISHDFQIEPPLQSTHPIITLTTNNIEAGLPSLLIAGPFSSTSDMLDLDPLLHSADRYDHRRITHLQSVYQLTTPPYPVLKLLAEHTIDTRYVAEHLEVKDVRREKIQLILTMSAQEPSSTRDRLRHDITTLLPFLLHEENPIGSEEASRIAIPSALATPRLYAVRMKNSP